MTVILLLAYGCPTQAIVHAFGLDERTVASWQQRAGKHCESVHKEKIEQGLLNLIHVQADEIWIKMRGTVVWVALAIMVPTRLWIAGQVSKTRDRNLIDHLMEQVRRCCKEMAALLICTDGLAAYPKSIMRAFRIKVKNPYGVGASRKEVWPRLYIGTVIKYTAKRRVIEVVRWMTHGQWRKAKKLLKLSKGGKKLNTSFIERLNGTFRERLASFTRKCRHAASKIETVHAGMYLIGCTYNFCVPHQQLSQATHCGRPCTPAMAAGLTDHIWSVSELLSYKRAPAPWIEPKRRGRPRKHPGLDPSVPKRPRGRPRKVA